ncbi:DUF2141 domain-containing protein [Swaminathania salitolerans]|uniref:DUF2141 domain-containing protein n=1 Tax=Swaminathania salitolerans TaxID=182838 RepID=A0A511BN38_9PROT|nr:DUF2141 domain-containing protein [Swaminathania salitolerans]GBQ13728.1 hypothetical protein AA21291_1602 [Swaminathania salitolerans LMG 21291]GEL01756.1 hypothetical protein SSA02_09190 [Swaminathania salitolerans]
MIHDRSRLAGLLAFAATSLFCLGAPARGASLTTTIENVPDAKGTIRIALCRKDEFLKRSCDYRTELPATPPKTVATFPDVKPGIYAVQVFQDRNGNGKLDRSFIGMPTEPVGFSRNPVLRFGPPDFAQCAMQVTPAGGAISLRLITR